MPVSITLTLSDADLAKFAAALGGVVAPALSTDAEPAVTTATDPKKKATKKAEAEPAPEETTEAATSDLTTDAQREAVSSTVEAQSEADMRSQLSDYYTAAGMSKKDVQNTLAGLDSDTLKAEYTEYLARLIVDETTDFPEDMEKPYIATRIDDGNEVKHWVKAGLTLTEEECKEAELEDPNAPKAPAPKGKVLPRRK